MLRRLLFPVPHGVAFALAGGVAGLTAVRTIGYLAWPYTDWVAMSAESRQALMLAGPWAAIWSAWCASRFFSIRSILCTPCSARSGMPVVLAQLRVLVVAAVGGWLAGLLPSMAVTVLTAAVGAPDLIVAASAAAALTAYVCLGYFLGALLPASAGPVAALVTTFLPLLAADGLGAVATPVWTFDVVAGQRENPVVSAFRTLFFLSAAMSLAAASASWLRARTALPAITSLRGQAILVVPVVLAVLAQDAPPPVLREQDPPQTCTEAEGVVVCVHTTKAAVLEPLTESVEEVVRVLGSARPPKEVVDAALWPQPSSETVVLSLQMQQGAGWRQAAVQDMAWQLSGAAACSATFAYGTRTEPADLDAAAVSGAVAVWMARQAGAAGPPLTSAPEVMALADRLGEVPASSVQAFLRRQQQALQNCEADSRMLP